jgi:hypothetical protein
MINGQAAHKNRYGLGKGKYPILVCWGYVQWPKIGEQLGLVNLQLSNDTGQQNKQDTMLFALMLKNTHLERCIE